MSPQRHARYARLSVRGEESHGTWSRQLPGWPLRLPLPSRLFTRTRTAREPIGSHNGTGSSHDATFLKVTQQYNLAEQAFGQIAQDRGQTAGISQLATTTLNEHKNAQSEGRVLAADPEFALPSTLSSVQQAQADQLKSVASSSFDLAYAENQVGDHQQSITSTQQEISHGSNSSVVSYAKSFLSSSSRI